MDGKEMLDSLQAVWENMTSTVSVEDYRKMLMLLDDMVYHLRYDLQIDYELQIPEVRAGAFDF